MWDELGVAFGIFGMRVLGNSITTIRLVMLSRGRDRLVFVLSTLESLIFAVALGAVVNSLESPLNLLAYSLGYAVGGTVGMALERRLTLGYVRLSVITRKQNHEVVSAIREAGFGATEVEGHGLENDVFVVDTVLERRFIAKCINAVQKADPQAFITTQALQSTHKGYIPATQPSLARILNRN